MDLLNIINNITNAVRNPEFREIAREINQMTGPISNSYCDYFKDFLAAHGISDIYTLLNKLKWFVDRYNNILLIKSPEIYGADDPLVKFKALKIVVENFLKGVDFVRLNLDTYSVFCLGVFFVMFGNFFLINFHTFIYVYYNFVVFVSVFIILRVWMNNGGEKKTRKNIRT